MSERTGPMFSIITPTFNSGPKLERTIRSVVSQEPGLYEYLVLDGGSSDGTAALLSQFTGQIAWESRPDDGVYSAMNRGVGQSSGRFIYFLGAGDTLRPGILRSLAPQLPVGPDVFAYGDVFLTQEGRTFNGPYSRWKLSRINICHQAVFCGRRVFDRVGLFDTRYLIMADYVFNLKCFGNPAIQKIYLAQTVADFEGGGLSDTKRDKQFLQDRLALFKEHLGFWPWAVNALISRIPAGLKESRYRWYRRFLGRSAR